MKKILFGCVLAATLLLASCMRDNGNNNGYNNNYNINSSGVTFWMSANCSSKPVTVTIDGQSTPITQYFQNSTPGCGAYGCANFNLPAGTYNYTASGNDSTWQGSVTVPKTGCAMQQLQCMTGSVTFWVDSAADNIKVTMNGASTHITVAFPTSTPTCNTTGCANFTIPKGTYTYTAITAANIGYTGSVTVSNDSCMMVRLY